MKNAMELEDAEQAYYSQWWRWGYDDQPPLYTWLQIGIHKILGVSKVSFSILRGVIFSTILVALFQFAFRFSKNSIQAFTVVLALVLIPTFIDFTFRRLSHTTLLCLCVVMTYYCIHKLIQNKSFLNYLLLGLVVGVGILTKYNYVLVLAAFGGVLFVDSSIRKVLLNSKILCSILIASLLLLPHLLWLFGDSGFTEELFVSVNTKTSAVSTKGIPVISPLFSFVLTFLKLTWPLLVVTLVLFLTKCIKIKVTFTKWLPKLFLSQIMVLILIFIMMDVQKVEARWLLPLFLPFPVLLVSNHKESLLVKWNKIGFVLFILVVLFQVVRTPAEKVFKISSSVHYGFEEISDKLQVNYASKRWILPDVTYAGNIRLLNKEREVFAADDFSLPSKKLNPKQSVFIVKDKNQIRTDFILTDSIMGFGKDKENLYFYLLRH